MRFEKDRVKKARFKSRYTWALAIATMLVGVIAVWTNNDLYDSMGFNENYPLGPILISSLLIGLVGSIAGVIDAETWNGITSKKASLKARRIKRSFMRFIELYSEGNYEKASGFYSCVNNVNMRTFLNGMRAGAVMTVNDRDYTESEKRTLSFLEEVIRTHKED